MLDFYAANSILSIPLPEDSYLGKMDPDGITVLNRFKITNSDSSNRLSNSEEQYFDALDVDRRLKLAVALYDTVQNNTCIVSQSAEDYIEILKKASLRKTGIRVLVRA